MLKVAPHTRWRNRAAVTGPSETETGTGTNEKTGTGGEPVPEVESFGVLVRTRDRRFSRSLWSKARVCRPSPQP